MSLINPSIGLVLTSSTALLTSIAILITNEYVSKLKLRCTKMRDWITYNTNPHEKLLGHSIIHKKSDEKEGKELKKVYNHCIDKRKVTMKNTQFKVEDISGDVTSKDFISAEQITKPNNFSAKKINISCSIKMKFFKPRKEKNYDPSVPPENSNFNWKDLARKTQLKNI